MEIIVSCEECPWAVVSRGRLKLFGAGPKPSKMAHNSNDGEVPEAGIEKE